MFYRNIDSFELKNLIYNKLVVYPKPFRGVEDSDAPKGLFSFWFDNPIFSYNRGSIIVTAEIDPSLMRQSYMRFTSKEGYDLVYYRVKEYYTTSPVKVNSIWISDLIIENPQGFDKDILGYYYIDGKPCGKEFLTEEDIKVFGVNIFKHTIQKLKSLINIKVIPEMEFSDMHIRRYAEEIKRVRTYDYE